MCQRMPDAIEQKESKILAQFAKAVFNVGLLKQLCPDVPEATVDVVKVQDLSDRELDSCLHLLDRNLGKIYASVNGKSWKGPKAKEMLEPGLVYVLIRAVGTDKLIGLVSMKIVNEYDLNVLYLYEIQVDESCRNKKLGTFAMLQLDRLVLMINSSDKLKQLWLREYEDEYLGLHDPEILLTGVALTVFSVNKGARKLYQRLGYKLHPDSAKDRVLRSGKVIEPIYYMLEKSVKDSV